MQVTDYKLNASGRDLWMLINTCQGSCAERWRPRPELVSCWQIHWPPILLCGGEKLCGRSSPACLVQIVSTALFPDLFRVGGEKGSQEIAAIQDSQNLHTGGIICSKRFPFKS